MMMLNPIQKPLMSLTTFVHTRYSECLNFCKIAHNSVTSINDTTYYLCSNCTKISGSWAETSSCFIQPGSLCAVPALETCTQADPSLGLTSQLTQSFDEFQHSDQTYLNT